MKLEKASGSQSQTLKENPEKTLSSAIDDQPKKKQKTIVDKDVIVIPDDDGDAPAQVQLATIQRNVDCVRTCHICAWNRPTPANPCHNWEPGLCLSHLRPGQGRTLITWSSPQYVRDLRSIERRCCCHTVPHCAVPHRMSVALCRAATHARTHAHWKTLRPRRP